MSSLGLGTPTTNCAAVERLRFSDASITPQWRRWRFGYGAALLLLVLVSRPQSAAACDWYNPVCWVEEGWDFVWDDVKGALDLARDIIRLKPQDAWDDFKDIAYNHVCGGLTVLSYAVGNGLEAGFNECDSPAEPIDPGILPQLSLYFRSSLDTVRIHKGCKIGGRAGITFGEHIYLKDATFDPHDDSDFALLAHELTHVLQYRKKGFSDFICEYGIKCKLGLDTSCSFEADAYKYQNMVLEDRLHDRDGIFSCPLGASDAPDCTKNPKFVACNSTSGPKPAYCKHLDNCPNHFNPGQEDFDNNIVGNACDVGWTSDPYRPTAFQTYGDFDGDHRADILVQNAGNIGILKYDGNSFAQLMIASDGALFGSWRYNSATDHVVAIADFNGDGKDDILVTCTERTGTVPCTNNIGILTFNGSSLTSLMTAPSETWFGGWRFQADVNRVAGTADLNRDGRQDIVVTSGWGIGILTFDGSSLTPLVLAPNGTQFGSWTLDSLRNSIVGFGNFNFNSRPDVLIRNANKLGVLTLNGNTLRLVTAISDGDKVGSWKFNAKNDRIAGIGRFDGGLADQILIVGDSGLAILGAHTWDGSEFSSYVNAGNGARLGNWLLDTKVNSIAAIGRFIDGFRDNIIIRSPWGMGILTYKDSWLTTSVIAPSGTRFGGWLYNSAADKILGKGSFKFLVDDILIGSEWGIGLLTIASSGSTLRSLMLAPNGTFFGNWPVDLTVDRLGVDKEIGAQTVPTWVSARAQ